MPSTISTIIATPNHKLAGTLEKQISAFPSVTIRSLTSHSELKKIEKQLENYQLVFLDYNWFENLKYAVEDSEGTKGYLLKMTSNHSLNQRITLSQNFDWLPLPADLANLGKIIYGPSFYNSSSGHSMSNSDQVLKYGASHKLTLFSTEGFRRIGPSEIIRCKAEGNYTQLFFKDGSTFLLSKNLKEVEKELTGFGFFRCHQSHLISIDAVTEYRKIGSWVYLENGDRVELSRSKKPLFMKVMCANH